MIPSRLVSVRRALALLASGLLALVSSAATAVAQTAAGYTVTAYQQEKVGEGHWILRGAVEMSRADVQIFADTIEFFEAQDRAIATGNVVMAQGSQRIAADRADINTRTQLGTFEHATGVASVRAPRPRQAPPGGLAMPAAAVNDVYYFGDTVERLSEQKYRITHGGFTTCVQPTPRWELSASTILLNVDDYTVLRNMQFKVKGVPLLYLPVLYYPTKREERSTGFLLPTYGISSLRGQSVHSAFFWAINRSQDATVMADWYSRTGTGIGSEYRYTRGNGSDGTISTYLLQQKANTYTLADGTTRTQTPGQSLTINGTVSQALPGRFRLRGTAAYFSSLLVNQTFNTNLYDAGRNRRAVGVNVAGVWHGLAMSGLYDRTEWFSTSTASDVVGSAPRVTVVRGDRRIWSRVPLYFSASAEAGRLTRQTRSEGAVVADHSVGRLDVAPQLRVPFTRWQFLTVTVAGAWRSTTYTRSLDPVTGAITATGLTRQFGTLGVQMTGPVFSRVWDTPTLGYADKFKHSIEPYASLQRTTSISAFDRIVRVDTVDTVVGSTTSVNYGIRNRLYAKRQTPRGRQAQEIATLDITQSYYSDDRASQFDTAFATSIAGAAPSRYSPVAIGVRVAPTTSVNTSLRAEVDSRYHALRTLSANATLLVGQQAQATVGWSRRFLVPMLAGFDNPAALDHFVNISTSAQNADRRFGTVLSANYDAVRKALLQERVTAFYNAQCCGIALEYQRYNFAGLPSYLVPADRRFFLSVTLAGLGNFSPFNGALGAAPR